MNVTIKASGDQVIVWVDTAEGEERESFLFEAPGMLSGCDLRDVLAACGISAKYEYAE